MPIGIADRVHSTIFLLLKKKMTKIILANNKRGELTPSIRKDFVNIGAIRIVRKEKNRTILELNIWVSFLLARQGYNTIPITCYICVEIYFNFII